MNLCSASNVTRVKFWNNVFKQFFYVVCSRSSASDAQSQRRKRRKVETKVRQIQRHLNKRIQRIKRLMTKSQRKLFQMKVMVMVELKMIKTLLRLLTMRKKKQTQRTVVETLQDTETGHIEDWGCWKRI